jgi:uncharacterized protein YndB with AHSA1/START domain/uncharacterized protein YciI
MPKKKLSGARAVADVTGGSILASVEIAAPPERVFTALTSADDVTKWWGSDDTYRTTEWTMKLEPGAKWRGAGKGADGAPFSVEGEVLEVDAPRKLVWTWRPAWDGGHTTTITYRLEPIDGGTRVVIKHEGFADRVESCRSHGEGWERVLGWLSIHVPLRAKDGRFFFFRLVPPRPTFPADMTPAEAKAMGEHAAYLRGHAQQGVVIAAGPVADPKGAWGLGVVEVDDEAAVHALTDGDPVIRSGLGFRYEVLPLMSTPIMR